ncbi:hypothetical protein [Paucidesulfovibrio gracilis]|uniref:hypothetical protein n=1 Tax=Paucidesulfovibrio gracilis TaxID=47158 RepID=UPI00117D0E64|nr:hypothetical protein [Paucidesulfovibrio gracilis]
MDHDFLRLPEGDHPVKGAERASPKGGVAVQHIEKPIAQCRLLRENARLFRLVFPLLLVRKRKSFFSKSRRIAVDATCCFAQ